MQIHPVESFNKCWEWPQIGTLVWVPSELLYAMLCDNVLCFIMMNLKILKIIKFHKHVRDEVVPVSNP